MSILRYVLLRLALLAGVGLVLWVLGMESYLLVLSAILITAMLSYLVLGNEADSAARVIADKDPFKKARQAGDDDIAEEDALLDDDAAKDDTRDDDEVRDDDIDAGNKHDHADDVGEESDVDRQTKAE